MRAHISLNVRDVSKSIEFYTKLFDTVPQKKTLTYAKFDLKNPPLNFSMQSGSQDLSRVSHLGIEVKSPDELNRWRERLNQIGLIGRPEDQTDCCFARQDKVWFSDPDGNEWEIFYVYEQLPVLDSQEKKSCCA